MLSELKESIIYVFILFNPFVNVCQLILLFVYIVRVFGIFFTLKNQKAVQKMVRCNLKQIEIIHILYDV